MMGFCDGSGINWTISKQSSPRSRHITTPTSHHLNFTGRMLFLTPNQQCQSTEGITLSYAMKRERERDQLHCIQTAELSMGPFCVTRSNPTHQLTDPTQVENLYPTQYN